MKQLTPQILALYLGCEVQTPNGIEKLIVVDVSKSIGDVKIPIVTIRYVKGLGNESFPQREYYSCDEVKPLLRPLSSMTEEEAAQVGEIVFGKHDSVKWRSKSERNDKGDIKYFTVYRKYYELFLTIDVPSGEVECYRENKESPGLDDKEIYNNQHKVTAYLLSKEFDLFGLIDANLAIDKTKTV